LEEPSKFIDYAMSCMYVA